MRIESLSDVRLPTLSVKIMAATLERSGINPDRAFRAAGIDWTTPPRPETRISAGQELAFQRAFATLTRDRPEIWLSAGFHYRLLSYGAYGLSILTSGSFRQAVLTATRDDLSYSLAHYRPIESDGAFVGFHCDLSEVPGNLREFTILRDLAAISAAFLDLFDEPFPFTRIELALPERLDLTLFAPFGCDVVLGCENTTLLWDPDVNLRPLPHADPVLREHFRAAWQNNMPRPDLSQRLLVRIMHELGRGRDADLSMPRLARRLGVSQRTLQRRLGDSGVSFSEIRDSARKTRALALVEAGQLDIGEIAWRLGYADSASFNHAFRRWTGLSPRDYRKSHAVPADAGA